MLDKRTSRARSLLEKDRLDALFIASPANLRYLCGFTGSEGALLLDGGGSTFLCDSRYTLQARDEVRADELREYSVKIDAIVAGLRRIRAVRVGFEGEFLSCSALERLRAAAGEIEWLPLDQPLQALRAIKDAGEVALLEDAADRSARALADVLPLLRPGCVESDFARELEFAMRRRGGDDRSFDPIVASGERGALPHGRASSRRIAAGELVTVDFGLRCNGYCSDETVTLAVGEVGGELREVHAVVLEAQQQALAAIRPGVALQAIDAAARDRIAAAGYGAYFGHGLGHGIGIEVHEYPAVSPRATETAREGMVFSVEPGIYLPGKGGVRIEDIVVVTATGCRKLTRIPKEYRQLP